MRTTTAVLAVTFAILRPTPARGAQAAQTPSAFEVTSVKPNTSGTLGIMIRTPPGRFIATNVTLRMLIRSAYQNMPDFRMIGGPSWIDTDRFDVDATAGSAAGPNTAEQLRLMIQSLLEDRFKMKSHMETRELPIYLLVLARRDGKLGDHLKPATNECKEIVPPPGAPPPPPPPPGGAPQGAQRQCPSMLGMGAISGRQLSIDRLADTLAPYANRKIVNQTNLTGLFDLDLHWLPDLLPFVPIGAPPPPTDSDAPPLMTALQEQLGLKLDASRGPVEVLVIDSVEKPSAD
jgi:uncharacterized protein (TIGR03435 family)